MGNIENKISLKVLERSKTDFFNSFEKERNNDFSQQKIKKSMSSDSSPLSKAKTIDYNNIVSDSKMSVTYKSGYVPPQFRKSMHPKNISLQREEPICLRVDNLPRDTSERDLRDLFNMFRSVTKVHLASNSGGKPRGFVTFSNSDEAQKAKLLLNGYAYANLILHVEFNNKWK